MVSETLKCTCIDRAVELSYKATVLELTCHRYGYTVYTPLEVLYKYVEMSCVNLLH